jgi:hypothetical protein
MLPLVWGVTLTFVDVFRLIPAPEGALVSPGLLAILAGVLAFLAMWIVLPPPVRLYVLGHELTHAVWGLAFGARVSNLKVGAKGGSVSLSKSNVWITLAPYFFPFYTFLVIVIALVTYAFLRPLPCLPLWMFLIGFTWAFHVLFTLETLSVRQPDVKLYGRMFSWTVIFIVNVAIVLLWLACTTSLTFASLGASLAERLISAYVSTWSFIWDVSTGLVEFCRDSGGGQS